MECVTLYGTRAWWRMKRRDEPNEPSKPGNPGDPTTSNDGSEMAPRAPFAPPVSDPSVLSILNGLNPSVTPVPIALATTDGEMSASYAGGPRRAPVAEETPAIEEKVLVRASTPPGQRKKAPSPDRVDTTFRIRPERPLGTRIAIGVLLGGVVVAAWLGRTASQRDAPGNTAAVVSAPVTPPSPDARGAGRANSPPIPPVEPVVVAPTVDVPEPPRSPARPREATDPVRPPRAAPSPPVTKAAPPTPARPEDDEPARIR